VQDLITSKSLGTVEFGLQSSMRPICSDDGSTLLVRTSKSDVNCGRIWDIDRGQYEGVPLTVASSLTNHVLSGTGRFLAAYTASELEAIDTRSGESRLRLQAAASSSIHFVCFSHSGRYLAMATNKAVVVMDLKTGRALDLDPVAQSHPITWIEYSPDDNYFVTAGTNSHMNSSYAQIWNAATGRPRGPALRQTDGIYCARFSPDGTKLVTTSEDFSAVIWDAITGAPCNIQRIEHSAQIAFASFSSDNRWLVTAGRDSVARVWDATTGNPLTLPFVHPIKLRRAYFAAGDTAIITSSDSGRTWYWKLPIETKPLSDLVTIAGLLSDRQSSYTPPEVYMTNDIFRSALKQMRDKYPEEFGAR
jgi:WD40 repeat protein